uniref:Glycoprotein endo-alpha-1,2-mannosidase-like protein n=1 Tax=Knipowitschia caucasica TaxID=637954 RepID=A0AAV2MAE0_KNICA
MGLRTLKPADGFMDLTPGLDFLPLIGGKLDRRSVARPPTAPAGQPRPGAPKSTKPPLSNTGPEGTLFYDVHIFYSTWYGAPQMDGKYIHWDHILVPHWDPKIASSYPRGRHMPPDDIGSSFYPELGAYSSRDPAVLESHMEQIGTSAAGVLVVSWYPPGLADDNGEPTEDLVPAVLDAAYRHNLKVKRRQHFSVCEVVCV